MPPPQNECDMLSVHELASKWVTYLEDCEWDGTEPATLEEWLGGNGVDYENWSEYQIKQFRAAAHYYSGPE
jgi:hypothetical protein